MLRLGPSCLRAAYTAFVIVSILAPAFVTISGEPIAPIHFVCKRPGSNGCVEWNLSDHLANHVKGAKDMPIDEKFYTMCGISQLIPISPHKKYIKVSLLRHTKTKNMYCETSSMKSKGKFSLLALEKEMAISRNKRQTSVIPSGRYRGQTQSQYLAIDHGNSKGEGKAEAHSAADSSRASVSGNSGMGQAQSQSIYDPSCEKCNRKSKDEAQFLHQIPGQNQANNGPIGSYLGLNIHGDRPVDSDKNENVIPNEYMIPNIDRNRGNYPQGGPINPSNNGYLDNLPNQGNEGVGNGISWQPGPNSNTNRFNTNGGTNSGQNSSKNQGVPFVYSNGPSKPERPTGNNLENTNTGYNPLSGYNPNAGQSSNTGNNPSARQNPNLGYNPNALQNPNAGYNPSSGQNPNPGYNPNAGQNPSAGQKPNNVYNPNTVQVPDPGYNLNSGQTLNIGYNPNTNQNPSSGFNSNPGHGPNNAYNPNTQRIPSNIGGNRNEYTDQTGLNQGRNSLPSQDKSLNQGSANYQGGQEPNLNRNIDIPNVGNGKWPFFTGTLPDGSYYCCVVSPNKPGLVQGSGNSYQGPYAASGGIYVPSNIISPDSPTSIANTGVGTYPYSYRYPDTTGITGAAPGSTQIGSAVPGTQSAGVPIGDSNTYISYGQHGIPGVQGVLPRPGGQVISEISGPGAVVPGGENAGPGTQNGFPGRTGREPGVQGGYQGQGNLVGPGIQGGYQGPGNQWVRPDMQGSESYIGAPGVQGTYQGQGNQVGGSGIEVQTGKPSGPIGYQSPGRQISGPYHQVGYQGQTSFPGLQSPGEQIGRPGDISTQNGYQTPGGLIGVPGPQDPGGIFGAPGLQGMQTGRPGTQGNYQGNYQGPGGQSLAPGVPVYPGPGSKNTGIGLQGPGAQSGEISSQGGYQIPGGKNGLSGEQGGYQRPGGQATGSGSQGTGNHIGRPPGSQSIVYGPGIQPGAPSWPIGTGVRIGSPQLSQGSGGPIGSGMQGGVHILGTTPGMPGSQGVQNGVGLYPGMYPTDTQGSSVWGQTGPTSNQGRLPQEESNYGTQLGNGKPTGGGGESGSPQNVLNPNSINTLNGDDSEAQASVAQADNGTIASASSKGGNDKGRAQTNVQGTYTGSGSFSAQAQISDDIKAAESEVSGGKHGASSKAQGSGKSNKSQASVQLGSETGSIQTQSQSDGNMHSSNSQVQGSVKGGMADSQARGPGITSSQAQIGFTPYKEGDMSHDLFKSPFVGSGTASAQSNARTGQSQSQLHGTFKYGITYNGAAQAGASLDKDAIFPNRLNFEKLNVFDEHDKNINIENLQPAVTAAPAETQSNENEPRVLPALQNGSENEYSSHSHYDHHTTKPKSPTLENATPEGSKRSFHTSYGPNSSDYEAERDDEYEAETGLGTEVEPEYVNYDDVESTHQALQSHAQKVLEVKQSTDGNSQHILLGSLKDQDAFITQKSSKRLDESKVYQPGETVPVSGGYTIPIGFTGSVKSVASRDNTYVIGSKDSPSQAQTVSIRPGTGKIKYVYPQGQTKTVPSKDLRSLQDGKVDDNRYVSVSKSVTRALDSKNNIQKQYSHTYYTKSSSCGYFTFTCTMVSSADGRKKVCRPKIPTNPDGTPMRC